MNDALRALMQDTELRKAFGARVKQLRKQRHWTQKELANRLDIRYQLLNKYEGGQHIPPAETLIDAIIAKRRVEGALAPLDREAAHG